MKATVRLAEEAEAAQCSEWLQDTPLNMLDPDILKYPKLKVAAADVNDRTTHYLPFHPVLMLESVAHAPDVTPREAAYAFRKLQDALEAVAKEHGMGEIYWGCKDESLIKLATKRGYEELPFKMYRFKVK